MPTRLEKLTICKFRGGTCPVDIDFDPTKPVAVIFGENGSGKSTIADAIAFGLTGDIGALDFVSVPGSKKEKYLCSIGARVSDMQVTVTVGGVTWKARLNKSDPELIGPEARPRVHVLRRVELLKLINAKPKDRYEALQDLIDVRRVENAEAELRNAFNDAKAAVNNATERRTQAEKTLDDQWKQSGDATATSALVWAHTAATSDVNALKARVAELRDLLKALEDVSTSWAAVQSGTIDASNAASRLRTLQERLETTRAGQDARLVEVLQGAEQVLESAAEACPVCEQPISVEEVRRRIVERLAELNEGIKLKSATDVAAKAADAAAATRDQFLKTFTSRRAVLVQRVEALRRRFDVLPATPDFDNDATTTQYLVQIENLRPLLFSAIEVDEKKVHQQELLATSVASVEGTIATLVELQARAKRLGEISEVVKSIRKGYVSEILTAISETAAEMYARLHPSEEIGDISLKLREAASGSLELEGSFAGKIDIPPQAYYSESHLDTLGLCVFLAMAKRDPEAIVILDDVFTSVDDAHLGRIIELLHDEANHVAHLVITTHYRAWRDRYQYARGPAAQSQLIELLSWTNSRGIRHTKTAPSADELRQYLAKEPLDRIGVAGRAGILLEALLDDLTLRYRCRLPRKTELNYTLGDLFGGIDSKLMKALRIGKPVGEIALEPVLQKLLAMTFLRNKVGCHFNPDGSNISDADVRTFGEATLALADSVICDSCGELPRREKTGEQWQCTCGSTKLMPLVKPGDKV